MGVMPAAPPDSPERARAEALVAAAPPPIEEGMSRLVSPFRRGAVTPIVVVAALALAALAAFAAGAGRDRSGPENPGGGDVVSLNDVGGAQAKLVADPEESLSHPDPEGAKNHPKAKSPRESGASADDGISPGASSDAEVRAMLKEMYGDPSGPAGAATLTRKGLAQAPLNAPQAVREIIAGGNAIADFPYVWGGGHGSFQDRGYDCSGSVSYALAAAGLLDRPMASGGFMNYGEPGKGKWVTIYANGGHMYMVVAGLRFDTSGRSGPRGSRWQRNMRSNAGFVARHPPGL
jgi:cell wall-associated NlpC family hydrolase